MNNIGKYIKKLNRDVEILEIGSGNGNFANFCNKLGFKNYIGFELDKNMANKTKTIFPKYKFYTTDIFEFLKNKKEVFDFIFISHVVEHLEESQTYELSKLIYNALKPGGIWINTMPNAQAPYISNRYSDLTHKKIYDENTFSRLLIEAGFKKKNIENKEQIPGQNIIIQKLLSLFKIFHKAFLLSAGVYPPRIFTPNFFTIIKKE